jgi:hypothetical protein
VNEVPEKRDPDWSTYDNSLTISPKDKKFVIQGIYYVKITPKVSILDSFRFSLSYQYYISFVTEDSF